MHQKRNNRGGLVAATLGCAMFLIALIVFQSAAAFGPDEPVALKPPFAFQVDDSVSADGFVPVPPSATRLLTETFGSGFSPTLGVTGTTTAWRIFIDPGSVNNYWARVIPALSPVYGDTAWAPHGGNGASLDPDIGNYPANMGTWLIYGPVDLRDYYAAEFTFNYQLDADPAVDGSGTHDYFGVGVSDDGTNFSGFQLTGDLLSAGWLTGTFNMADYAGKSSVYIGFYFRSNGDANVGRGAFVDNVSLRAAPVLRTFMPQISRNFTLATPTPTSVYNFTFDSGLGANDPDFVVWGQSYNSSSGGITIYEQGLIGGNPGDGMYLYNTRIDSQGNHISFAGPDVTAPTNFEISADFHVNKGKDNARYGVIFGGGSNTFGRGSQNRPTFDINANYYKFALQFPGGPGNDPRDYQLERCSGNGAACTDLIGRTAIPGAAAADGVWDNIKVRRQGTSIVVLVNNVQILSVNDGTFVGDREFGMFVQAANVNGTANPLEIFFDSYRVTQLP